MRRFLLVLLAGSLSLTGCFLKKKHHTEDQTATVPAAKPAKRAKPPKKTPENKNSRQNAPTPGNQNVVVTPENALIGKVVKVNSVGRFVVLNFPVGHLPTPDQHFLLYRKGVKVGEVRIASPLQQLEENVVADFVNGEAEEGDEAKTQ